MIFMLVLSLPENNANLALVWPSSWAMEVYSFVGRVSRICSYIPSPARKEFYTCNVQLQLHSCRRRAYEIRRSVTVAPQIFQGFFETIDNLFAEVT